jgi:hypothetical protein
LVAPARPKASSNGAGATRRTGGWVVEGGGGGHWTWRDDSVALNLFGVTFNDAHDVPPDVPGTEVIGVRDLGAIVGQSEYDALEPTPERVTRYAAVVTAFALVSPVLPAPVGVVFKSRESVIRWLELHYVALNGALSFVENKVEARVHISRPGPPEERETGSDLAAVAAESLRVLRRSSTATVPLRHEKITGIVLSAAFLVEQELWKEFARAVDEQCEAAPNLRFELTGPWPPYDFVQMQLGA